LCQKSHDVRCKEPRTLGVKGSIAATAGSHAVSAITAIARRRRRRRALRRHATGQMPPSSRARNGRRGRRRPRRRAESATRCQSAWADSLRLLQRIIRQRSRARDSPRINVARPKPSCARAASRNKLRPREPGSAGCFLFVCVFLFFVCCLGWATCRNCCRNAKCHGCEDQQAAHGLPDDTTIHDCPRNGRAKHKPSAKAD